MARKPRKKHRARKNPHSSGQSLDTTIQPTAVCNSGGSTSNNNFVSFGPGRVLESGAVVGRITAPMIEHNDYINASNDRSVAGLLRDIEAGELGTKRQLGLAVSDHKKTLLAFTRFTAAQHGTYQIDRAGPVRRLMDILLESTA